MLNVNPGVPSRSKRINPAVAFVRRANSAIVSSATCIARLDDEPADAGAVAIDSAHPRNRSTAAFAITTFMIASPYPVDETPPASESA